MKTKSRLTLAAVAAAVAFALTSTSAFASSCHGGHAKAEKSESADAGAKKDTYPISTCVVSGEELGSMGEAHVYEHEGREVRFCCKMCKKDFLKDPDKYLAKLDAAAEANRKDANTESESKSEPEAKKSDGHGHDHGHGHHGH